MIGKYLLLGTNLGDKKANIYNAHQALSKVCTIKRKSALYETAAWGKTDQPSFYNQIVEIETNLNAEELLSQILAIETKLGRIRFEKWGERVIDIDILYYDDLTVNKDELQIPHPGIADRKFTLVPLVELAADLINPSTGLSNKEMLEKLHDTSKVEKVVQ
ncbi:2-amino-4-hydroxy-6-hydroxymethyldihydropteridine diphosphokinase [Fulvivirga lutea]|uniref:2-amino-4-hydroxy-6-hydroxymethyldihydropteridine pyrophosphokinase n=2 Tax=Fulvivirga lutea TaxID=2810512 RepID=A0A974WLG5_9BACT|nr:2-amino-4-hydroxy-6-hydroxymethyldihydropteridine diphosphokinase [Fulvivirga lutea]